MVGIIKFLKGYVRIRVWGYSPERFMNLCGNHDILLWNIVNHGDYYTMCVSIKGFFSLKNCLKKTGTRLRIEKRYGLPFLLPMVRKRKIFAIGFAGCFLFLCFMSRFIWAIDIEGNLTVTDDVFLDFLEQNGIQAGMRRDAVVSPTLEEKIRERFDIITWTSVQLDGTRLVIQVKENEHPGEVQKEEQEGEAGRNLLADADGVIVKMITRTGVPLKKPGDEVKRGELLVQGQVPILNEDGTIRRYEYCEADADIFIQYRYPVREKLPSTYIAKEYTGRLKKQPFFRTMKKEYRLPQGKAYSYCDMVTEERQIRLFGNLYLPLIVGKTTYREYLPTELSYSSREAGELLKGRLAKLVLTLEEKGVQIIQKDVKIVTNTKYYILKGNFTVISQAVVSVPIEKDQTGIMPEESKP